MAVSQKSGKSPDKSRPVNWEDCREKKSGDMKDVNLNTLKNRKTDAKRMKFN